MSVPCAGSDHRNPLTPLDKTAVKRPLERLEARFGVRNRRSKTNGPRRTQAHFLCIIAGALCACGSLFPAHPSCNGSLYPA